MKVSLRGARAVPLPALLSQPKTFVARLVLAEALAKRGEGALERKNLRYMKKRET